MNPPRRLPPFAALSAFDAVARHGTFTRAALELNVSQPAISRRIAALEADLGTPMFGRDTRPLRLTADGRRLFEVLRASLSRLEQVVQEIRGARPGQKIVLGVDPGFASYWLLPRLPRLQAAFANYSLRILTGDFTDDRDDVDLLIEFGIGRASSVGRILGENVFAVCSPAYLAGRRRVFGLEELREQRLLWLEDPHERWYSWRSWFETLHQPFNSKALKAVSFNDYSLLLSAALAGQGVALGWEGLIDQFLENGSLVRVSKESVRSERGYYVSCTARENSAAQRVAHWLVGADAVSSAAAPLPQAPIATLSGASRLPRARRRFRGGT
ncbi:MAG: LysR substrate-binding domain-containing protein [Steroidobacteraceae bacterium]|jgi:DNA-binding transcriptional LysR family regulator